MSDDVDDDIINTIITPYRHFYLETTAQMHKISFSLYCSYLHAIQFTEWRSTQKMIHTFRHTQTLGLLINLGYCFCFAYMIMIQLRLWLLLQLLFLLGMEFPL